MRPARTSDAAFLRPVPPLPSRMRLPDPGQAAVGALLNAARKRRGLHQEDVATFAEVSLRAVRAWESGAEAVPPERAADLALFLDLPAGALDSAAHVARTAEERAALAAFRSNAAEGQVMTFEPATDCALRETGEAYGRAGIVPRPEPAPAPALLVSSEILPAPVRLGANAFAAACVLGAVAAQPNVLAALVPAVLVLGVEVARAAWDLAQRRGVRS